MTTSEPSNLATVTSLITIISALVSILCGLAILWSYRQVPHIQNYTRYLLVCLTIADIFTAYGNLISTFRWFVSGNSELKTDAFCVAQSFITTTATLSSFFWTTAIAIYLFSAVALRKNIAEKRTARIAMTVIPVVIPVTITSVALGYKVLGEDNYSGSGPWCWIKSDISHNLMWKLVTGKAWEIMTYMITLVIYILLKFFKWRKNCQRHGRFRWSDSNTNLRDADNTFEISWLFLLIARVWGTSRFILQAFNVDQGDTLYKALLYMQCVGDSSQASWNFLFFFTLDTELREQACQRKCCLSRGRRSSSVTDIFGNAQQTGF